MKIYTLLATGFEEAEAIIPADILKRAGAETKFASVDGSDAVCGAHGIRICADLKLADISKEDVDCLLLPGGMGGTKLLRQSRRAVELIRYCYNNGVYIGAICAAPSILGEMGLLYGKQCTCYPGYEKFFKDCVLVKNRAVRDEIFITGLSAGAAYDYAFLLVETLFGKDAALKLRRDIIY